MRRERIGKELFLEKYNQGQKNTFLLSHKRKYLKTKQLWEMLGLEKS